MKKEKETLHIQYHKKCKWVFYHMRYCLNNGPQSGYRTCFAILRQRVKVPNLLPHARHFGMRHCACVQSRIRYVT